MKHDLYVLAIGHPRAAYVSWSNCYIDVERVYTPVDLLERGFIADAEDWATAARRASDSTVATGDRISRIGIAVDGAVWEGLLKAVVAKLEAVLAPAYLREVWESTALGGGASDFDPEPAEIPYPAGRDAGRYRYLSRETVRGFLLEELAPSLDVVAPYWSEGVLAELFDAATAPYVWGA